MDQQADGVHSGEVEDPALGPRGDEGLARRLKALACTAPLHDLDARKSQLQWADDLLARLRSAEEKEARARVKWEEVMPDTGTRAGTLLYTPDGADAAFRTAGPPAKL